MAPGRWQFWQARCRIGATSFVKVTCLVCPMAGSTDASVSATPPRNRVLVTSHLLAHCSPTDKCVKKKPRSHEEHEDARIQSCTKQVRDFRGPSCLRGFSVSASLSPQKALSLDPRSRLLHLQTASTCDPRNKIGRASCR